MMIHLSIQFFTPLTTPNNLASILHPVWHRHPAKNGSRSPSQRPSIPPSIHHHLVTFPPAGTPNCTGCCNSVYPPQIISDAWLSRSRASAEGIPRSLPRGVQSASVSLPLFLILHAVDRTALCIHTSTAVSAVPGVE